MRSSQRSLGRDCDLVAPYHSGVHLAAFEAQRSSPILATRRAHRLCRFRLVLTQSLCYGHIYIYIYIHIRRAYGPGRVRSRAMTSFLVSLLTPLPPQWILGAHNGHVNRSYCIQRATLKITKTITGAQPNRPDQRTNMSNLIFEI